MGPPNAGKSTLLNALLGQKVTIVTPKPQTTRNQIVGILTDEEAQVIFMDTPGLTQVRGRLSKTMIQAVWQSLGQADVIMPILDSHLYIRHPEFLDRDLAPVAEALASDERPMIVVVNKVDLFSDKSRMLPLLTRLNEMWPRADIFPTSALRRDGLPELKALIRSKLPEGPAQFPEDQISTASLRFMAAEPQKSGIMAEDLPVLADYIVENCPHLELRGLMCLPPVFDAGEAARPHFARLRVLCEELRVRLGLPLPELSMGMSGDFEAAVAEGATLVRIGTDIFGPRPPRT